MAGGLNPLRRPVSGGEGFFRRGRLFAPVVFRIRTYQLPVAPQAAAYCRHMLAQPAMRRWLEDALAETWREPEHEEDVARAGEIIEDLRAGG